MSQIFFCRNDGWNTCFTPLIFRINVSCQCFRMIQRKVSWLTRTATSVFLNHSVPSLSIFPIRTDPRTGEHLLTTHFRTVTSSSVGYKIQDNLRDCYSLLNVKDGCSQEELKEAYIRLAKLYHPDSQSETADPKKFGQVKEAYKTIKVSLYGIFLFQNFSGSIKLHQRMVSSYVI